MRHWLFARGIIKPIRAVSERTTEGWVAEQPDTGIWGSGKTQDGAIEDLRRALADHRAILMSSTAVAPHLSRQRAFLAEHLGDA